jgi:predicted nucleic acid-binding protein
LSWYDALIVAAAMEGGCSLLYSEDLQSGRRFGDLRIENPFA